MKIKILHIIDTLDVGGAERIAVTLANIFAERGHEIGFMIILPGDNPLQAELNKKIKIFLLNRKNKYSPLYSKEIASITSRYDFIHIHSRHNLRYIWFNNLIYPIKVNKIIFHDHHGNINNDHSIGLISRVIISKIIYCGVSKELCKWAEEICHVKKAYLLENVVLKQSIINQSNRIDNRIQLILVSNIHPRKNIEFSIEVINGLIKKSRQYCLDIFGKITDKEYYFKLKGLIKTYGLEDLITINPDCNNIQKILYKYDLALHTSKSETGPLVLIEYLAQSLPFLAFSTGEVITKLEELFSILVINNFDKNNWISQIERILNLDRNQIIEKMTNIYLNNYSSEDYYNKCHAIYQKNLF